MTPVPKLNYYDGFHPYTAIPSYTTRSSNLPGSFCGFAAKSRNSDDDPIAEVREVATLA